MNIGIPIILRCLLLSPYFYILSQILFFLRFGRINDSYTHSDLVFLVIGFISLLIAYQVKRDFRSVVGFFIFSLLALLLSHLGMLFSLYAVVIGGVIPYIIYYVMYK